MIVLVLGSGGREHAIVRSLAGSPKVIGLIAAPGNGGTAALAENVSIDNEDPASVSALARERGAGLVVVGPEAPLVAGVADALAEAGIPVFGPSAAAARMEGSKDFAKQVMARHSIPTARTATFTELAPALEYVREQGAPIVVKADGLAAGKGVTVATAVHEAERAIAECFAGRFGDAGSTVLVEEFLEGPECSLLAFCDGATVVPMVPAQDHKRAFDGDAGPNTGGMGVYSPVPSVTRAQHAAMVDVLERAAAGLASEGIPFRGVLYGGFVLTSSGPKVLEFNVRFGDPETQVILPRLAGDLAEILLACAEGRLAEVRDAGGVGWREDAAVSVVLASGGYPADYEKGKAIAGIEAAEDVPGVTVFHAGTTLEDGRLVTSGGRVLNVTACALTLGEARRRAYEACRRIRFEGMFYRHDIGARAVHPGSSASVSAGDGPHAVFEA